jgi:hypothetical protein
MTKIDPTLIPRGCFFCPSNVEMQIKESIDEEGLIFVCSACHVVYKVTNKENTRFKKD